MKRITVFCGSNIGTEKIYQEEAYLLGKTLAENSIGLVYGGSNTGLMGMVANGVIENKGEAIGVLPHFLKEREIAHTKLSALILVDSMHERKTKMNEMSDGAIALPGGLGTLEELFEMLTWAQLQLHEKPIGILNVNGFYDNLLLLIQNMADKGFITQANKQILIISNSIEELIKMMKSYQPPVTQACIK